MARGVVSIPSKSFIGDKLDDAGKKQSQLERFSSLEYRTTHSVSN